MNDRAAYERIRKCLSRLSPLSRSGGAGAITEQPATGPMAKTQHEEFAGRGELRYTGFTSQ